MYIFLTVILYLLKIKFIKTKEIKFLNKIFIIYDHSHENVKEGINF